MMMMMMMMMVMMMMMTMPMMMMMTMMMVMVILMMTMMMMMMMMMMMISAGFMTHQPMRVISVKTGILIWFGNNDGCNKEVTKIVFIVYNDGKAFLSLRTKYFKTIYSFFFFMSLTILLILTLYV